MPKKIIFSVLILFLTYSLYAQNIEGVNARIDAMGGAGVTSDIGWTIGKPSSLYGFGDQVQLSALIIPIEGIGQSFGSIIAIKSLGENLFLGITLNNRRAMSSFFYKKSSEFGGFGELFDYETQPGQYFPDFPQVNFCIRPNDNLSIGVGAFLEHSKYDATHKPYFVSNVETGGQTEDKLIQYDSTTLKKYFGIGGNLDARIWFGESGVKINPEFRIFFPFLDGSLESNALNKFKDTGYKFTKDTSLIDMKYTSNTTDLGKNMYLRAGAKISATINETFWILGLWYQTEKFELEKTLEIDSAFFTSTSTDDSSYSASETSFQYNKNHFSWWLGCEPSFSDNLIFTPEYSGKVMIFDILPPPGASQDSTLTRITHKFRLGAEMSVKGFWIFKEFLPRFGAVYYITRDIWDYKNSEGEVDTTSELIKWPYSSNCSFEFQDDGKRGKITAGFGLKGKRGYFDLSLDLLNWEATGITGPGAAIATVGMYFGRKERE